MANNSLDDRLAALYQKRNYIDQFIDADLKTIIDAIRDAREHGGTASVVITPLVGGGGYKITITDSDGVAHDAEVRDGGDAYAVYESTVPEGQTPMSKTDWLASLKGADGADGQNGAPGHNPCLGRFTTLPTLSPNPFEDAQAGDYFYYDTTDSQTSDPVTYIYHFDGEDWDSGTVIDAEHPTLASGQAVTSVAIKDENGNKVSGNADMLSAEAGSRMQGVIFESLYNNSTIDLSTATLYSYRINPTEGSSYLKWKTSNARHFCFEVNAGDYFEITANATRNTQYAFLKTHEVEENVVSDLVDGFQQVFTIPTEETMKVKIPEGCNYFYILRQSDNSTIYMPSNVIKFTPKGVLDDTDVVDSLNSTATSKPLSAKQGKVLDEKIAITNANVATLDEKLNDVDIKDVKVPYILEGEGQNVFKKGANAANAQITGSTSNRNVVVDVKGASFVKFVGPVTKSSDITYGWFFKRDYDTTSDSQTDSKQIYDYDTSLVNNYTTKEYVVAVPPTAEKFYFSVVIADVCNLLTDGSPLYCTLIYGNYIGDVKNSIENLGIRNVREIKYKTGDWYKDWDVSFTNGVVLRSVYPGGSITQSVWYNMPLPTTFDVLGDSTKERVIELSQYPSFYGSHVVDVPIGSESVDVWNLEPNSTWYYKVYYEGSPNYILNSGSIFVNGQIRQLKIGSNANEDHNMLGIDNVRDIGGWKVGNSVVKYGLIFRGRELNAWYDKPMTDGNGNPYSYVVNGVTKTYYTFISQAGKDELLRLGVCMEFDLRASSIDPEFDNHSIIDNDVKIELQSLPIWVKDYLNIYNSQTGYSDRFAQAIRTILKYLKTGGSIYIHCAGGADRTGSLCIMLEGILGVSLNDIILDYELSERSRTAEDTLISAGDNRDSGIRWAFEYICNLVRLPNGNTYTKCHSYRDSVITIGETNYTRDLTVGSGKGCVTSNDVTYFAWINGSTTYYTTDKYPDLFSKIYTESGGTYTEDTTVSVAEGKHTYWFDAKVASVANYAPAVITDTDLIDSLENAPATELRDKFAIMLQLGDNPLTDKEIEELRTIMIA